MRIQRDGSIVELCPVFLFCFFGNDRHKYARLFLQNFVGLLVHVDECDLNNDERRMKKNKDANKRTNAGRSNMKTKV
jgi:hypothetical protein